MLFGLIVGLLVGGSCYLLMWGLLRKLQHPLAFLAVYLPLGVLPVVFIYFALSLVLVFHPRAYWVMALSAYSIMAGHGFRALRAKGSASAPASPSPAPSAPAPAPAPTPAPAPAPTPAPAPAPSPASAHRVPPAPQRRV